MLKTYTLTFTQNRKTYITRVVPANNLAEAYIAIQENYPGAEITEAFENSKVTETWVQTLAKYMIAHSRLDEVCTFADSLDDDKREELVNAIWDEWHKLTRCENA